MGMVGVARGKFRALPWDRGTGILGVQMKIFIWRRLEELTTHWHPEGGLVVIAKSLEVARAMIRFKAKLGVWDAIDPSCDALTKEPDLTFDCSCDVETLIVFPNSGCC